MATLKPPFVDKHNHEFRNVVVSLWYCQPKRGRWSTVAPAPVRFDVACSVEWKLALLHKRYVIRFVQVMGIHGHQGGERYPSVHVESTRLCREFRKRVKEALASHFGVDAKLVRVSPAILEEA